jgi:hypothetical protein
MYDNRHGQRLWEGSLAVYAAYSDESGTPDPDGQFVVGGYVLPESDWPDFSKKWAENVLDSKPKIPYLHMVELRSKAFQAEHGLNWEDCLNKAAVACQTIHDHQNVRAYFGSISRKSLKGIYETVEKQGFTYGVPLNEPDYMCFLSYAWHLIRDVGQYRPDVTRINFMVAKKQRITHYYKLFKDELRSFMESDSPQLASLVGDLIPISPEDHLPAQAADVFCWHLQRHYANNLASEDLANLILLSESRGTGKAWTSLELLLFANGIASNKP